MACKTQSPLPASQHTASQHIAYSINSRHDGFRSDVSMVHGPHAPIQGTIQTQLSTQQTRLFPSERLLFKTYVSGCGSGERREKAGLKHAILRGSSTETLLQKPQAGHALLLR